MIAPTTTLLAYIPSPPQGVWHLGAVPLRAYALCIIVGIVIAVWWGDRRWQARGGQPGEVLDIAIWAVPFGLIGGRIYHVLTDWQIYFGDGPKSPMDVFRIWDGGLGIWGAVIFGALGAWIGARLAGIRLPAFGDAIAPPILLAQAIGRLGNYFNQELYGRETTLPWGLEIYERTDGYQTGPGLINGHSTGVVYSVVQPTFLYELLWNVLVVIVLVLLDRYLRIGHGRLFALYVAGYCVGRFVVELLRSDTAYTMIAGVRINVFTAAVLFVAAAIYFVVATKGREQGLEMYHPRRAAELRAEGVLGYVDDQIVDEVDDEVGDEVDPLAGGAEPAAAVDEIPAPADDGTVDAEVAGDDTRTPEGEPDATLLGETGTGETAADISTGDTTTEAGDLPSESGADTDDADTTVTDAAAPDATGTPDEMGADKAGADEEAPSEEEALSEEEDSAAEASTPADETPAEETPAGETPTDASAEPATDEPATDDTDDAPDDVVDAAPGAHGEAGQDAPAGSGATAGPPADTTAGPAADAASEDQSRTS
ncbi:prolipoprotein diacylglyceryl transferase [Gordonia sp. NPDC003376]